MNLNKWVGEKFHYLTIVEEPFSYYDGKQKRWKVKCQCDCGNVKEIGLREIKKGITKSCGCWQKYSVNYNFFEKIDNKEKAYVLGLWYADGSVHSNGNTISIGMCDLDIIEKIRKEIKYNGPIYVLKNKSKNQKKCYKLYISSLKLKTDLIKWGCVPRKSHCLQFPQNIPDNLMSHFICGLFDGDGCLSKYRSGKWCISIAGTKNICEGLQNYLRYGGIYINRINPNTKYETWAWRIYSKNNIRVFLDYIYKDTVIYLERKYKKYQEFIIDEFGC